MKQFFAVLSIMFFLASCMRVERLDYKHETCVVDTISGEISSDALSKQDTTQYYTLPNGIVLEVKDDLYYWDDMVFTDDGLYYLCPEMDRSGFKGLAYYYWPYGIVYYTINSNIPSSSVILSAMSDISSVTSITFIPRTTQSHYVEFYLSNGNNSEVGMQSNGQRINLSNYNVEHVVEHEILHALGFHHEHCRSDRDSYIVVNWDNIKPAKRHNFYKESNSTNVGSLDFNSIMIYDSIIQDPSFVYDTTVPVMTKLSGDSFSQGTSLSTGDIAGISSIYGPPYHRLEHRFIRVVEDKAYGFAERYITEEADSLVFYADASCTVRQALQYSRNIGVISHHMFNQGSGYEEEDFTNYITIPAGTSSYCIRHGYNYFLYYASDSEIGYNVWGYDLVNRLLPDYSY